MVTLVGWYASLAVVQAALAVWVVLAQPRRLLNWAVGTLLLLWAGSGLFFQLMREAEIPGEYVMYNRIASYYEAPTFFLVLLILDRLLVRTVRPRWWTGMLIAAACVVPVLWVTNAATPSVGAQPLWVGGAWRTVFAPTFVPVLNAFANILAQVAIVHFASRAAVDVERGPLQRRQAALVGLAFALLLAQPGGVLLGETARAGLPHPTRMLNWSAFVLGLCVTLHAWPRLASAFQGTPRIAVHVAVPLAVALGVAASLPVANFGPFGVRVVALSTFALLLAVAVLRYDLADGGLLGHRRLQSLGAALAGLACAVLLAGVAWSAAPRTDRKSTRLNSSHW